MRIRDILISRCTLNIQVAIQNMMLAVSLESRIWGDVSLFDICDYWI